MTPEKPTEIRVRVVVQASVEIYHPEIGEWAAASPLTTAEMLRRLGLCAREVVYEDELIGGVR